MLKIKFLRQYRKRETGNLVFVSKVTGEPAEIAEYVKAKVAEGAPEKSIVSETDGVLFYSNKFTGTSTLNLIKTKEGKWFPDTTKQDQIMALQSQGHSYEAAVAMTQEAE
jgi:hypothetical protein